MRGFRGVLGGQEVGTDQGTVHGLAKGTGSQEAPIKYTVSRRLRRRGGNSPRSVAKDLFLLYCGQRPGPRWKSVAVMLLETTVHTW